MLLLSCLSICIISSRLINYYKLKTYIVAFLFLMTGNIGAQEPTVFFVTQSRSDSTIFAYLSEHNIPITTCNKVELLKSGKAKFEDLFSAIKQAKRHVHLEYFNFRNDSIANALFDLLAIKVKEGVEVRALFDAFGNWSNSRPLKKKHLKKIRARGIEIYHFDPLRFPYINHVFHRDHRKIAIVDGKIAYTGGMNIADYYIKGFPEIGVWRDMHIRIEGGSVKYLQDIFLTIWNKTTKQQIGGPEYFPIYQDSLDGFSKSIAIVDRTPKKTPKQIRESYVKSIESAQKNIQIVNPYFLPTRSIKRALRDAITRGVKVEIMLSSKADIGLTPDGSIYVAHRLMKKGANIYLYNGGFHHSKIMMVDNSFCTVGTSNLDSRSLKYDYEVNTFIFDKEISNELIDLFDNDKTNCTILTRETWKQHSAWRRFVGWFADVLSPFL